MSPADAHSPDASDAAQKSSRRRFLQSAAAAAAVTAAPMMPVKLAINGHAYELQVEARTTLPDAVREYAGLTGTKKGSDRGQCGACTVIVSGRRINSCLTLAVMPRLSPKTAHSQLMGGIVWGVGSALFEKSEMDARYGRYTNANLAEYHVPVNADIGSLDIAFVEQPDPHINPLGARGIGEIGITGVAGALGNAVYHATGVRVRDLPITLDKVLPPTMT